MVQVQADPAEIRRFQSALRKFNDEVAASTSRIRAQLRSVGSTWRDTEYTNFSQELEAAIQTFERYSQNADNYIRHLDSKAAALEAYHNRR